MSCLRASSLVRSTRTASASAAAAALLRPAPARPRSPPPCRFSTRARLSRTSCSTSASASASDCRCTSAAACAWTSSQYASRTSASVLTMVSSRSMSAIPRSMRENDQLRPLVVGPEAPQQPLRVREARGRGEARVEVREGVGRFQTVAVPGCIVPTATPPHPPADTDVVAGLVGDDGCTAEPAAVEQRAARLGRLVQAEAGRSQRQKRRAGRTDLHVPHEWTDALDGDLPVAFEGPLNCVGEREIEPPYRPRVLSGPKRDLGDCTAAVSNGCACVARAAVSIAPATTSPTTKKAGTELGNMSLR